MWKISSRVFVFILAPLAGSTGLIAQTVTGVPRGIPGGAAERGTPVRPDAFGTTEYSVTSVSSSSFVSEFPSSQIFTNFPLRYFADSSSQQRFLGSVSIPEGVVIDYIGINNCDPAGASYELFLYDVTMGFNYTPIFSLTTNHNSCQVDYNSAHGALGYQYPSNAGHSLLVLITSATGTPTDGTAGVSSVEVWWRRQVSPAPGTADFGDVPTSNPQFQFIEALYHAGITAGCGGGNYCPDNPVTRGQMAVFLAKALGLNWPEGPVP
jgi:S-layer homology domain